MNNKNLFNIHSNEISLSTNESILKKTIEEYDEEFFRFVFSLFM